MARPGDVIENPRIGARMVFFKTGRETAGELMEADLFVRPGNKPPPKHIHPAQEERFKVIDGSLTVWIPGREIVLGPGDEYAVAKGTLHTWRNAGESEARVRVEVRPAGRFDEGLEALYAMIQNGNRNPLQFAVTMWSFRNEGTFPFPMNFLMAAMAAFGRLLGYNPDYPYPYAPTRARL
jgi:quercetin dioxygenase-like cupin family protein